MKSIQEAGRFVLLKEPTNDYMTRLDLIDVDPSIFRSESNIHLSEQELEQLRLLVHLLNNK